MLSLCVAFLTASFAYGAPPSWCSTPTKQVTSGMTVYLRGWTGKYLDVEGTEVQCRWNHRGEAFGQAFIIEQPLGAISITSGSSIYLRAHTGNHIDVEGEEVQSRWDEPGEWQELTIERADGPGSILVGDAIYLKAHTGKYVYIEGTAVNARHAQRGWQKLTIEVSDKSCERADRLKGVAQQSSIFNGEGPGHALDGDMKSMAHTVGFPGETNPWWQLDVGKSTSIGQIRLLNRPDRCANRLFYGYRCDWQFPGRKFGGGWGADISVSDVTCSGSMCPQRKICARLTQPKRSGDHWYDVICDGAIGRYVSVVLPGKHRVLNFMEIEIYPARVTQQLLLYESFEYPAVQGGTEISKDGLHMILKGWRYGIHTDLLQIATESHDNFTTPHGSQALKVLSYMGSNHGGAITTADALNATLQPNTKYTLTANVAKLATKPYGDYLVELWIADDDDDTEKWVRVAAAQGLAEKSDMSESLKIEIVSTSTTIDEERKPVVRTVQFGNDALSGWLPVGARLVVRLRKNDVSHKSNIPLYDNVQLVAQSTQQLLLHESFEDPTVPGDTEIQKSFSDESILRGWKHEMHPSYVKIASKWNGDFTTPHGNQALRVFSYNRYDKAGRHGAAITTADALSATLQPNTKYTLTANVAKVQTKENGDYFAELNIVDSDTQMESALAETHGLAEMSNMSESLKIEIVSTSPAINELGKRMVRIMHVTNGELSGWLPVGARLMVRLRQNNVSHWSNMPLYDNVQLVAHQADAVAVGLPITAAPTAPSKTPPTTQSTSLGGADAGSLHVDGGARRLSSAAVGPTLLI